MPPSSDSDISQRRGALNLAEGLISEVAASKAKAVRRRCSGSGTVAVQVETREQGEKARRRSEAEAERAVATEGMEAVEALHRGGDTG
jgi:Tfp pilus assembly protein FimT